jgi:chromosome segregation ATPase
MIEQQPVRHDSDHQVIVRKDSDVSSTSSTDTSISVSSRNKIHITSPNTLDHSKAVSSASDMRSSLACLLDDGNHSSLNYQSLTTQKQQMQNLNKQLASYIQNGDSIEREIHRLSKENEALKRQLQPNISYQFEELQGKHKDEFDMLRREIHKISEECNQLEHEKRNITTETELITQKTLSLEKEKHILENSISNAQRDHDHCAYENEQLDKEIQKLRAEIEAEERKYG